MLFYSYNLTSLLGCCNYQLSINRLDCADVDDFSIDSVSGKKIGMQDKYGESGSAGDLVKKYGLDGEGVYNSVKEFLK